ncbi:MAG: 50S ribosomal protein L21 [Alkalinema sp. CACIAM 70d]|uniref:50S ribosomal protein L21 n=1 Tax=Alkalinema sp. FACHB-956 TaxID=2692768 RepID=UPI000B6618CF|nr:50S ribosomal protein L21 [Alkalinema sp. FACHB-956]MBD2327019.1 50S ribosomal protein L21 [Alkalinema sp. FACHB-956]OUC13257.1 MAG: 50S ribosomal protein L21 [Alkalinema sp. CACIAM 70d]
MAYAIIETGGKQMRVEPGRFYDVERLVGDADTAITIDKVLFVSNDGAITVGQPTVSGATVQGKILKQFRAKKVLVYKMQPKKKTRKKRGHRQEQTRLLIESITVGGQTISA